MSKKIEGLAWALYLVLSLACDGFIAWALWLVWHPIAILWLAFVFYVKARALGKKLYPENHP